MTTLLIEKYRLRHFINFTGYGIKQNKLHYFNFIFFEEKIIKIQHFYFCFSKVNWFFNFPKGSCNVFGYLLKGIRGNSGDDFRHLDFIFNFK